MNDHCIRIALAAFITTGILGAQIEIWKTPGNSGAGIGDVNGDKVPDFIAKDGSTLTVHSGKAPHPKLWTYTQTLGRRCSGLGDIDGDGWPEFAMRDPDSGTGVYVFTSRNGTFGLVRIFAGASRDGFGIDLDAGYDVDGDRYLDVLVGAYQPRAGNGYAELVSGKWIMTGTGSRTIHRWTGSQYHARFGLGVAMLGDIDGDQVSEIAVGELKDASETGRVSVFSGRGGKLLRQIDGSGSDSVDHTVERVGDVSNPRDGVADLLIFASGASRTGVVRVVSGQWIKTGQGAPYVSEYASRVAHRVERGQTVGDCDADGWPDYAIASKTGYLAVLSGKTHKPIYETLGQWNTLFLEPLGDINGDAVPDFVQTAPQSPAWQVRLISGKILRAPKLTAVAPAQGRVFGGERVSLQGSDLGAVSEIRCGGVPVDPATIEPKDGGTKVEFVTPMGPALGRVPLLVRAGTLAANAMTFTYVATPSPICVAPFATDSTKSWEIAFGGPSNAVVVLPLIEIDAFSVPPMIRFSGKDILDPFKAFLVTIPTGATGNGVLLLPPLPTLKKRLVWAQTVSFSRAGFDGVSQFTTTELR